MQQKNMRINSRQTIFLNRPGHRSPQLTAAKDLQEKNDHQQNRQTSELF